MGTKPLRLRSMWVIFIFRLLYFFSEGPCLRLLDLLGCFLSLIAMDHLSLEHLFLEGLQDFVGVDLDSRTDTLYFSANSVDHWIRKDQCPEEKSVGGLDLLMIIRQG